MNYYILLVALVLVTAFLMYGTRRQNKLYVFVACLLLFAIYGLRNTFVIGGDTTSSYLHMFEKMPNYTWREVLSINGGVNTGFYLLAKTFYEISGGDYQLFVSFIAAFYTICFGKFIYRYSPNPLQSILYHFGLLFFTFHFSVLKQTIAMAMVLLSFDCLIRGKNIKYFILILAAAQFHYPAYVFFLAYPLFRMKINRNYLFYLAGLLAITFLLRNQLVNLMLNLYKDLEDSTSSVDLSGVTFLRTKSLIMIVIVVAAVAFRKPKPEDKVYSTLLAFMGIAIVFQTFCGYNNIFERLADYYFQFSVVFIPMVFDKSADREPLLNWRMMSVIDSAAPYLFCGFAVYRFITYTQSDRYLYPFKFFFQN